MDSLLWREEEAYIGVELWLVGGGGGITNQAVGGGWNVIAGADERD